MNFEIVCKLGILAVGLFLIIAARFKAKEEWAQLLCLGLFYALAIIGLEVFK